MLSFKPDVNNKRVMVQLGEMDDRTRKGIRQFWFALGKSLITSFNKAVLAKPRSGRTYLVRKRKHTASRPGETAANLTGNYRKAIDYQLRGAMEMDFGNRAEYGGYLENGTKRMKPRPGLKNAIDENEGQSITSAEALIKRELLKR